MLLVQYLAPSLVVFVLGALLTGALIGFVRFAEARVLVAHYTDKETDRHTKIINRLSLTPWSIIFTWVAVTVVANVAIPLLSPDVLKLPIQPIDAWVICGTLSAITLLFYYPVRHLCVHWWWRHIEAMPIERRQQVLAESAKVQLSTAFPRADGASLDWCNDCCPCLILRATKRWLRIQSMHTANLLEQRLELQWHQADFERLAHEFLMTIDQDTNPAEFACNLLKFIQTAQPTLDAIEQSKQRITQLQQDIETAKAHIARNQEYLREVDYAFQTNYAAMAEDLVAQLNLQKAST